VESVARWLVAAGWARPGTEPGTTFNEGKAFACEWRDWRGNVGIRPPETPEKIASRVAAVARWLVAAGWAYQCGNPGSGFALDRVLDARRPETSNLTTEKLASRLSPWPVPLLCHHGSALDIPVPEDASGWVTFADPSYKTEAGKPLTGYTSNIYAEDLRDYLLRFDAAGAVVVLSDARPLADLMGPGWISFRIDQERRGQKRTFARGQEGLDKVGRFEKASPPEWLTMNREPAWKPGRQVGLFGGAT